MSSISYVIESIQALANIEIEQLITFRSVICRSEVNCKTSYTKDRPPTRCTADLVISPEINGCGQRRTNLCDLQGMSLSSSGRLSTEKKRNTQKSLTLVKTVATQQYCNQSLRSNDRFYNLEQLLVPNQSLCRIHISSSKQSDFIIWLYEISQLFSR